MTADESLCLWCMGDRAPGEKCVCTEVTLKIQKIEREIRHKIFMGGYETIEPCLRLTAVLDDGDDPEEARKELDGIIQPMWAKEVLGEIRMVHKRRGDQVPSEDALAVVSLVQSVCKGYARYPQGLYQMFGMVMVDEVQRMGAEKFSEAMYYFPAVHRVGLSATPHRKDGRDVVFHAHIGTVDISTELRTLIPKIIQVDTGWEVPTVWNWKEKRFEPLYLDWGRVSLVTQHFKDQPRRTATIVNFLQAAVAKGRMTVVFSDTVEYLSIIKDACVAAGLQDDKEMFGYYCGLQANVYEKGNKQAQRDKAKVARICLATYKMCSEATDVPWWDTAVLATPKADVEQPIGRILREYEGKFDPVVLDLCDYNHHVLATFAGSRLKWYESIGAEVINK